MMFARTSRLTLRPGWPEDAPALARAIAHEEVVTKLSRAPWPYGLEDAETFLARPREATAPKFLILSHDAEYPCIVGSVAMWPEGDAHEFGYWLTPAVWGRGYATEAGQAVLDMARHALGVKRIRAGHFIDNPASGRVLTKLGFRPTGRIEPRPSLARGGDTPCALFELDLDEDRPCEVKMAA
jgi:RimJ/RimL family protein N-acetyltransferase